MSSAPFGDAAGLYEGFHCGFGGGHGHGFSQLGIGAPTSTSSDVLVDGGTEDLDAAAGGTDMPKRKGGGERGEKAAMALRSHSEAERRRRERINAHLATLRSMVPCTDKLHGRAPASGALCRRGVDAALALWQRLAKRGRRAIWTV